jgi:acyl transferase domain-containing protein
VSEGKGERAAALFASSMALAPLAPRQSEQILEISPRTADWRAIAQVLADFYRQGMPVDWAGFDRGYARRRLALPTYPFERRRYWLEPHAVAHPLLGRRLEQLASLPDTWAWESRADTAAFELFDRHRVLGSAVLPYSAYVEMALSAASQAVSASYSTVKDLDLHSPLFIRAHEPRMIQAVLRRQPAGHLSFAVYSRLGTSNTQWQKCASAELHQGDHV